MATFYQRRSYFPAWTGVAGPLGHADRLIEALELASDHGLDPEWYGVSDLARRIGDMRAPGRPFAAADVAGLDTALTLAFLAYGGDLRRGRVSPADVGEAWPAPARADLAGLLQTALDVGEPGLGLAALAPPQPEYTRVQEALRRYRLVDQLGGWPPAPRSRAGRRLSEGAVDSLVRRLEKSGDMTDGETAGALTDGAISRGLSRFQRRHGLRRSGRLDAATAAAMAVPARQRANQLAIALERWRWLPHDLGARYVLVRITDFELDLVTDGHPMQTHRVVVGEPFRRTPVFGSRIESLVINPTWYVPERIAREEVLPLLWRDPEAAERLGYRRWSVAAADPDVSTEWEILESADGPLRVLQLPGPANALGKLKVVFPNSHQVYLHDTPNASVFAARERGLSHGCIRVEGARQVAEWLLNRDGKRGVADLAAAWEGTSTRVLELADPVPIYVLYWTAGVTADGEVHFRQDLYDGDRRLMAALGLQ